MAAVHYTRYNGSSSLADRLKMNHGVCGHVMFPGMEYAGWLLDLCVWLWWLMNVCLCC